MHASLPRGWIKPWAHGLQGLHGIMGPRDWAVPSRFAQSGPPRPVQSRSFPRHVHAAPSPCPISPYSRPVQSFLPRPVQSMYLCIVYRYFGRFFRRLSNRVSPQDHPLASKHARWRGRGFAKVRWRMDESQYKSNECRTVALCIGRWHHLPSSALRSTQSEQSFFPRVFFVVSTGYFFDFRFAPSK